MEKEKNKYHMQRLDPEIRDIVEKLLDDTDFRDKLNTIILNYKDNMMKNLRNDNNIFELVTEYVQSYISKQREENIDKFLDE